MTLSLVGRCPETGMLGGAITSSSICVARRCLFTRAGVGAALTQNVTDPTLGGRMLDLLAAGANANTVVSQVVAEASHIAWRQLVLLDSAGRSALHTGDKALGRHASAQGTQCTAAANLLGEKPSSADVSDLVWALVLQPEFQLLY